MQKQTEQTRDQLASQLESLFSDPKKYIENKAKQMVADILANWLQQLMQFNNGASNLLKWLFGQGPQMNTSTNPLSAIGSVFGLHIGSSEPTGL